MEDTYRLWEVLGTWASGIGALAAVVTSLYLARRADRPNLQCSADIRVLIDPSLVSDPGNIQPSEMPEVLVIEVTNLAALPAKINSIGWHWKFIRRLGALQNPPVPDRQSHGIPATLAHGDQLQWAIDPDGLIENIASHMLAPSRFWRIKLRLMRIVVSTSTGHRFKGRIGPTLRKKFAAKIKLLRAKASR